MYRLKAQSLPLDDFFYIKVVDNYQENGLYPINEIAWTIDLEPSLFETYEEVLHLEKSVKLNDGIGKIIIEEIK